MKTFATFFKTRCVHCNGIIKVESNNCNHCGNYKEISSQKYRILTPGGKFLDKNRKKFNLEILPHSQEYVNHNNQFDSNYYSNQENSSIFQNSQPSQSTPPVNPNHYNNDNKLYGSGESDIISVEDEYEPSSEPNAYMENSQKEEINDLKNINSEAKYKKSSIISKVKSKIRKSEINDFDLDFSSKEYYEGKIEEEFFGINNSENSKNDDFFQDVGNIFDINQNLNKPKKSLKPKFCPNCGKMCEENTRICEECGSTI